MIKTALSRKKRVRGKIFKEGYRLSISRSNRFLFAQIIEQKTGRTLFGLSDKKLLGDEDRKDKTKTEIAKIFGLKFGKEALAKKIKTVIFDRGSCKYHGRVKAFAEGAKEGGLVF